MIDPLAYLIIGVSLLLALWAAGAGPAQHRHRRRAADRLGRLGAARRRPAGGRARSCSRARTAASRPRRSSGYLIGCVIIPPLAVVWALAERSRYGPAVILVAYLVMPVLEIRLLQIWNPGG